MAALERRKMRDRARSERSSRPSATHRPARVAPPRPNNTPTGCLGTSKPQQRNALVGPPPLHTAIVPSSPPLPSLTLTCCSALSTRFICRYTCVHKAMLQGARIGGGHGVQTGRGFALNKQFVHALASANVARGGLAAAQHHQIHKQIALPQRRAPHPCSHSAAAAATHSSSVSGPPVCAALSASTSLPSAAYIMPATSRTYGLRLHAVSASHSARLAVAASCGVQRGVGGPRVYKGATRRHRADA